MHDFFSSWLQNGPCLPLERDRERSVRFKFGAQAFFFFVCLNFKGWVRFFLLLFFISLTSKWALLAVSESESERERSRLSSALCIWQKHQFAGPSRSRSLARHYVSAALTSRNCIEPPPAALSLVRALAAGCWRRRRRQQQQQQQRRSRVEVLSHWWERERETKFGFRPKFWMHARSPNNGETFAAAWGKDDGRSDPLFGVSHALLHVPISFRHLSRITSSPPRNLQAGCMYD